MAGVPPIDRDGGARATAQRAERRGWFSRPRDVGPTPDQEAEVRARLYAKPPATERTVERVAPIARAGPIAERPAA